MTPLLEQLEPLLQTVNSQSLQQWAPERYTQRPYAHELTVYNASMRLAVLCAVAYSLEGRPPFGLWPPGGPL